MLCCSFFYATVRAAERVGGVREDLKGVKGVRVLKDLRGYPADRVFLDHKEQPVLQGLQGRLGFQGRNTSTFRTWPRP
jgi:hypothetical protein